MDVLEHLHLRLRFAHDDMALVADAHPVEVVVRRQAIGSRNGVLLDVPHGEALEAVRVYLAESAS